MSNYLKTNPDITDELIMDLVKMLDGERLKGGKRWGERVYYVLDNISYRDKLYRLVWWTNDNESNELYVSRCCRRD